MPIMSAWNNGQQTNQPYETVAKAKAICNNGNIATNNGFNNNNSSNNEY
jgi:hypothetical protein